tara:strand:+ start:3203 stop:4528 length:1326 start_codon:yes stop_codon:yes gene_type:complete
MERFTNYVQDSTLRIMLMDTDSLKIIRSLVASDMFDGEIRKTTCQSIYDYYDKYKHSPTEEFIDFFFSKSKILKLSKIKQDLYEKYIGKLYDMSPNKEYVLGKLSDCVQKHAIAKAVLDAAELVRKGDYEDIKEIIIDACRNRVDGQEVGESFWDYEYRKEDTDVVCKFSIPELNTLLGGYVRGELFLWLAATGVGKSWAMIEGVKDILRYGGYGVYYTLEMSKNRIQQRIGMALSGLRRDIDRGKKLEVVYLDGTIGDFSNRETISSGNSFHFSKKFYKARGGEILVKEFVEGKCMVDDLHNHLNSLETIKGFVPDIIFVDYADLIASDKNYKNHQDEIDRVFTQLRGLAKERNIAVVSASQANRQAFDASKVTLKNISKSIGKVTIADIIIALCQTDKEEKEGEMRLFGAKVREGRKHFEIRLKQCFAIGGFSLESEFV